MISSIDSSSFTMIDAALGENTFEDFDFIEVRDLNDSNYDFFRLLLVTSLKGSSWHISYDELLLYDYLAFNWRLWAAHRYSFVLYVIWTSIGLQEFPGMGDHPMEPETLRQICEILIRTFNYYRLSPLYLGYTKTWALNEPVVRLAVERVQITCLAWTLDPHTIGYRCVSASPGAVDGYKTSRFRFILAGARRSLQLRVNKPSLGYGIARTCMSFRSFGQKVLKQGEIRVTGDHSTNSLVFD